MLRPSPLLCCCGDCFGLPSGANLGDSRPLEPKDPLELGREESLDAGKSKEKAFPLSPPLAAALAAVVVVGMLLRLGRRTAVPPMTMLAVFAAMDPEETAEGVGSLLGVSKLKSNDF